MEYPKRKHPRLKTYNYSENGYYFITVCTKNRAKVLGSIIADPRNPDRYTFGMQQIHLSQYGTVCLSFIEQIPSVYTGVFLDCFVIMPDHIHLLLHLDDTACTGGQGSGRPTVHTIMHAFKRLTAKALQCDLWQSSYYEHIVRNDMDLHEIRNYIAENPMKWAISQMQQGKDVPR